MRLLNKLERKYGKYAIKNLMMYIIGLNALVFALGYMYQDVSITDRLMLIPQYVLKGEVWRLVTYIFIPPTNNILFVFFVLYFYYLIGMGLEHEWGSFKFNVYYFLGMAGTTIAAFLSGTGDSGVYLNMSLFLAFAYIYPEYELLLFFVLPIKMKYLGWIDAAILVLLFLSGGFAQKLAIVAAFVNFGIFFGKEIYQYVINRKMAFANKRKYESHHHNVKKTTYHRCTVCGKTEKDDAKMEFRYCSGCEGHYEYCMDHLKNHIHKTAEDNVIELEDYKRMKAKK